MDTTQQEHNKNKTKKLFLPLLSSVHHSRRRRWLFKRRFTMKMKSLQIQTLFYYERYVKEGREMEINNHSNVIAHVEVPFYLYWRNVILFRSPTSSTENVIQLNSSLPFQRGLGKIPIRIHFISFLIKEMQKELPEKRVYSFCLKQLRAIGEVEVAQLSSAMLLNVEANKQTSRRNYVEIENEHYFHTCLLACLLACLLTRLLECM